jgi:hypothetical protein
VDTTGTDILGRGKGKGVGEEGLRKMFGSEAGKKLKMEELPDMYRNIRKR